MSMRWDEEEDENKFDIGERLLLRNGNRRKIVDLVICDEGFRVYVLERRPECNVGKELACVTIDDVHAAKELFRKATLSSRPVLLVKNYK